MSDGREYGKLYPVAKALVKPVMHALWRVNTTGLHHAPDEGPAIFCPNHISFIDSMVLPAVLPRRISYVGKAEYMDSWKTRYLFPAVGMIPIDRGSGSQAARALDTAARVLERGEFFGIYPEGTRSRSGKLHRGHTGAARLAIRTGAPILPVGLIGTDVMQAPDTPMPRPFISCQVNIGAPIDPARYADRDDMRLALRQLTDEVMFEIAKLSGQEYTDVYANKKTEPAATSETTIELDSVPAAERGAPAVDGPEVDVRPTEVVQPERERVLVAAGVAEEEGEFVDQRASSADVLAQWWS